MSQFFGTDRTVRSLRFTRDNRNAWQRLRDWALRRPPPPTGDDFYAGLVEIRRRQDAVIAAWLPSEDPR